MAPDGTIRTLYTDASAGPSTVAALPDGAVLIAQSRARRVLRVTRDVGVETLAGGGFCGVPGSNRPSGEAGFGILSGVAVSPTGAVLLADTGARRVLQLKDAEVSVVAGAGLRVPRSACATSAAPLRLLATTPRPPTANDSQYGGNPCARRSQERFNLKFRYIKQKRVVRRVLARRRFAVHFYVSARVRAFIRARRTGSSRNRWRAPARGAAPRQGNSRFVRRRGLRRGRYKLFLSAFSTQHQQRVCRSRFLRAVRRR